MTFNEGMQIDTSTSTTRRPMRRRANSSRTRIESPTAAFTRHPDMAFPAEAMMAKIREEVGAEQVLRGLQPEGDENGPICLWQT